MSGHIANPFQDIDIFVPAAYHPDVKRFTRRTSGNSADDSPFMRMIDFWFFSLCVAVSCELEPTELGAKPVKIIDGAIFGSDPWRIYTLLLIGIGIAGDVEIVQKPRKIAALASRLAAAGIPKVVSMLEDGDAESIWNLSDSVQRLLAGKKGSAGRDQE